jgi:predicted Fe-S protein YdhL (DUF1289 family)
MQLIRRALKSGGLRGSLRTERGHEVAPEVIASCLKNHESDMMSKEEVKDEVKSPCVKKCSLDRNKICPACNRSIDEIVSWRAADDSMKRKILEAAKRRRSLRRETER